VILPFLFVRIDDDVDDGFSFLSFSAYPITVSTFSPNLSSYKQRRVSGKKKKKENLLSPWLLSLFSLQCTAISRDREQRMQDLIEMPDDLLLYNRHIRKYRQSEVFPSILLFY